MEDRDKGRETLARREEQLLEAQEVASLGFYVHNLATGVWTSSSVLDRIFGISADYPRTVEGWGDLVHPDERQAMLDYFIKEVAGERKPFQREYRIVRHEDKQVRWVHGLGRLEFNEEGRPVSMLGTIQDITERKLAEEALQKAHDELERRVEERTAELREANEQLVAIYNGMVDGIVLTDIETMRFVKANAAICQMLGHSEPELLSLKLGDIHPADALPHILETISSAEEVGQTPTKTIPFLRKDGSIFFAEAIGTFLIFNGKRCSMGIFRDITERRKAEEALRQSEERYELAVRGAGVGIWDWDIRTGKVYFSPRWRTLLGYGENEIGGNIEDYTSLIHPDDRERVLKFRSDFLAGTSLTGANELRLRHKDGSYRWIAAHGVMVRDERGKACRLVGSHGDITDRKRAEEALERERQSLWRMLQASDHERQTISYEIHDGLAQYLAAANMQLQVFDGLRDSNPEEAKKAYDAAAQLVRQSHAESRRLISEVRPPVIDEIGVETAISHLVHEQRQRGGPTIKFDSDVQFGRLPAILENAIYRIAQEALTNACKHSKSKKVTVAMTQEGQDVRLEVQDWGIGFDPESVEQGHFGLEGMRQRVRLLDGKFTIKSTPGSGTLVQVVVPILERQNEG